MGSFSWIALHCVLHVLGVGLAFDLTVLHVNDIHVRLEETNLYAGICKDQDKGGHDCYGGVARLVSAVDQVRAEEPNSVFLNGGDFYQGNVWYTHFKWRIVAHFANILNFTAMAAGNHEFDDHVAGFVPFLKNTSFPTIAANIDVSKEPSLEGLISPSVVIEVGGRRIGIIGYVTTDTPEISNSDKVEFIDEVVAISQEAKRLKADGVDILIALGHSGYTKDQEIARNVPDIDLVVGGHSHSFLNTGPNPSVEKPDGPYPTVVTQDSGRTVPVIQAYAFTKYLGRFKMTFDDQGEAVSWEGAPMLLDKSIPQDDFVLQELVPWRKEVEGLVNGIVASSKVVLLSRRGEETNLGNLVTDSMVDYYAQSDSGDKHWTYVPMAFINSGGLRSSFEMGNMTMADILTVLPFENTVDIVTLRGSHLKGIFEEVAGRMKSGGNNSGTGGFLQVSGIQVTLDLRRAIGDRVTRLYTRCSECKVPKYSPLDLEQIYNVSTVSYLAKGGDANHILRDEKLAHIRGPLDSEVFKNYVERLQPLINGVENRITMITDEDTATSTAPLLVFNGLVLMGSAIISYLSLAIIQGT
eukprot:maker-scaffold341_size202020-snap-gene-1.15 protein:Tk03631 transcript:maker-scaffold341_size202020-snap-gene-1.15-mRNA-1 annotation:"hypothetical protein DAPPUDRAFT_42388"